MMSYIDIMSLVGCLLFTSYLSGPEPKGIAR